MPKFEDEMTELDTVVDKMELGGLGLEDTIALYERGGKLLHSLRAQIIDAERRIRVVDELNSKGILKLRDLELSTLDEDDELDGRFAEE